MQYTKAEAIQAGIYLHDIETICKFHLSHPDQNATMHTCQDCIYIFDDNCYHGSDDFCKDCDPEGKFLDQCPQCYTVDYTPTCEYCIEHRKLSDIWSKVAGMNESDD